MVITPTPQDPTPAAPGGVDRGMQKPVDNMWVIQIERRYSPITPPWTGAIVQELHVHPGAQTAPFHSGRDIKYRNFLFSLADRKNGAALAFTPKTRRLLLLAPVGAEELNV